MTTFTLESTDEIEASPTAGTAVQTPYTPTISSYNVWYNCGTIEWTSLESDVILCNGIATTAVSAVTGSGTDRSAVFFRSRLIDDTIGQEVWASANTTIIFYRIGTVDYGLLNNVNGIGERFWSGPSGLLVPGHDYTWTIEVMKQQVVNTPTLTLTVADASVFADAAKLNA